MPDLAQFAIVYATALPLTLLVSYLCERWWGNRYRTALQLRQLARRDRQETEAIRDAWAECFESSAHELYGVRVRDHLARLKAERDEARAGWDRATEARSSLADRLSEEVDWREKLEDSLRRKHQAAVEIAAERDEARKEAKEWETVAEHLARPYVRAML